MGQGSGQRAGAGGCIPDALPDPVPTDCSDPAHSQLREQFEDALRIAERFSHRYDELMEAFQQEMLNTSRLLDQLNRQFGWVSRLANLTQNGSGRDDGFFQVTTVSPCGCDARRIVAMLLWGSLCV